MSTTVYECLLVYIIIMERRATLAVSHESFIIAKTEEMKD